MNLFLSRIRVELGEKDFLAGYSMLSDHQCKVI